jgi:uncharacterized repeat protein (TIGR01451 family)
MLRCEAQHVMRRGVLAICCLLAPVVTQYACAQDAVPVETTLIAEVQDNADSPDGRALRRLVPAGVVTQGDVVYYTVQIRNLANLPARDVEVVQRVPANTTYVPSSASGPSADITFSTDGGQTFKPVKDLIVATPAGTTRPATPADYTHIRWRLRNVLAPGAVALARFQAVFQ